MEEPLDIFNSTASDTSQLSVFADEAPGLGLRLPNATIRNRAAMTSMLSQNPEKVTENYQLMVAEGNQGVDTTVKQTHQQAETLYKERDQKTMMQMLADPSIPFEQKQAIVKQAANSVDARTMVMTNSLARPSKGETKEAEQARVNLADGLAAVDEAIAKEQSIINAYQMSKDWKSAGTLLDTAALMVLPGATQSSVGGTARALLPEDAKTWDKIKSWILPGSALKARFDSYDKLPAEQRLKVLPDFIAAINNNSSVILGENQITQMAMMGDLSTNGYGSGSAALDNLGNAFEMVGLGLVGRALLGPAKAAKGLAKADVVTDVNKAPMGTVVPPTGELGVRPRNADEFRSNIAGQQDTMIKKLEDEKAGLLGDAGNQLDRGVVSTIQQELADLKSKLVVPSKQETKQLAKELQTSEQLSFKQAMAKAQETLDSSNSSLNARIQRLEGEIEKNRVASSSTQRIAAIEKEIEQLQVNRIDAPGALTPIADLVKRIEFNALTHTRNPASPAAIIQQTNPEQARSMFQAVFNSEGDAVAEAMYGTTRMEALAGDVLPQAITDSGRVRAQPIDLQRNLRTEMAVPEPLIDAAFKSGALEMSEAEKAMATANKVNQFSSAKGLHVVSGTGHHDGRMFHAGFLYGTPEGAFTNAEDAYNQARYALRSTGILDNEITIMQKQGIDYVPVKLEDVKGVEGNYLVRAQTDAELNPSDITNWDKTTTKLNFFDRLETLVSNTKGSLTRWIFDAASIVDPKYSGGFTIAKDKAAAFEGLMLEQASKFSDGFMKLNPADQVLVNSYIREANAKQIKFDTADLMSRGLSSDAIDTVNSWRKFWDTQFYFENLDLTRTMQARGFELFQNEETSLIVKPLLKPSGVKNAYDPLTDSVITVSKTTEDELYASGGYYARLARPTDFAGDVTEHVFIRNTPTEFTRKIRDTDSLLNYRDGYYTIQYKAPLFVDEIDDKGIKRAIAVAGDREEAELFRKRKMDENPDFVYPEVRYDNRAMRRGSDDWFDINSASGRVAQRHRGKLLEAADETNVLGDAGHVVSPVDSAIHAAKSLAGRTIMRPVLETAKSRFMDNHKELLKTDGMGGKLFPMQVSEIGASGAFASEKVAQARSEWEFINYMEKGYVNTADKAVKALFYAMADMAGTKGYTKTEKALLKAADITPSSMIKGSVFGATVVSNPARQLVVQSHQSVRAMAYNPKGILNGGVFELHGEYFADMWNGSAKSDFTKFLNESGLLAAVDKQILVRDTLLTMADQGNALGKAAGSVLTGARKIGYDVGEKANLVFHAAAVYERYKRKGFNLADAAVRDDMHSEIRAISGDMNYAGDMPYNQTTPSVIMQFMLAPHKTALMAFNRRLDAATKTRIVAGDLLMFGTPTKFVSDMLGGDILPDDKDAREMLVYGMEHWALNNALRTIFNNEDINLGFASSLSPYPDLEQIHKLALTVMTEGPWTAITNSPFGTMYLKDGSRVQTALGTMTRYFGTEIGLLERKEQDPVTAIAVAKDAGRVFSGISAGMDAWLMFQTGKYYDKYGNTLDDKTNGVEAFATALGIRPQHVADYYRLSTELSNDRKALQDEVNQTMDRAARLYQSNNGTENGITDAQIHTVNIAMTKFGNNPIQQQMVQQWMKQHFKNDQYQDLIKRMMDNAGFVSLSSQKDRIRQAPGITEEGRAQFLEVVDHVEKTK